MITRHYFVLLAFLLAAHVTGCRTPRPAPDERPNASLIAPPARLDSTANVADAPAVKPGILSGIGRVFSTPAGTARRQAVRLAKASAPRIGKKAQATIVNGNDNQVSQASIGKNKAAAVLNSDSATVQIATNASAGRGNTTTQTATVVKPPGVGATIAKAIASPLGFVLATAAGLLLGYPLYLLWAFIHRRNKNANQA